MEEERERIREIDRCGVAAQNRVIELDCGSKDERETHRKRSE